MKKIFFITIIFLFITNIAHAQRVNTRIHQVARKTSGNPAVVKSTLSPVKPVPYGGNRAALMGAMQYSVTTWEPTINQQVPRKATRSWGEQLKRDLTARTLKHNHTKWLQERLKIQQSLEQAPRLCPELAFTTADLTNYVPSTNQSSKPVIPVVAQPKEIAYRGLALGADGQSIRNILTNGLRVQDAGKESNTLNLSYASQSGYTAMKYMVNHPVTNVTEDPQDAATWGESRLRQTLPVLTVVRIKGPFSGGKVEVIGEDMPADQIIEVIAQLNINGTLTWCKVELNAQHTFTVTPYHTTGQENLSK